MSFDEMFRAYRLEGRTLVALFEKRDVITLRFDLYHSDDPERCRDGMEYLLDVAVHREQFRIADGARERLRETFSADILRAELADDELRLVADCSFYAAKDRGVVEIALTGSVVALKEHSPTKWPRAPGTARR
ncbi:hypothetical protein [Aquamicrobium sp. LC103]|uniref:hypothetical protein n=1 Tax=Aquamicrobium sp. LC103 TaxID=1120658 RepID=UPI00063EA0B1|nr:hypothetical protein [Aquamicrobium sp. LC103]TKT75806.1 hypothetical protein XW59_018380 [Aquamicrobium sp. LC103]